MCGLKHAICDGGYGMWDMGFAIWDVRCEIGRGWKGKAVQKICSVKLFYTKQAILRQPLTSNYLSIRPQRGIFNNNKEISPACTIKEVRLFGIGFAYYILEIEAPFVI